MRSFVLLLLSCLVAACGQPDEANPASPDGKLKVKLELSQNGVPQYQVEYSGVQVLKPSSLGLTLDGENLHSGLKLVRSEGPEAYLDLYSMHHGKQRNMKYAANESYFVFENKNSTQLGIRVRVSNHGVAYRYELPGTSEEMKMVEQEHGTFAFPLSAKAWLQKMSVAQTGWSNVNPSYEEHYQVGIPVGTESPSKAGWVFPALFESEGHWVLISEAGMDGSWHASRLLAKSENGVYKIGGPTEAEVITDGALMANGTLPLSSPWRFLAIGSLADIAESTLGTDLAEPARYAAKEFQPGFASWSWALLKDESVNDETTREFIDYAAKMNWEYTLIDVNWDQTIGAEKIQELADYAKSKGVGLLLWYNSSGDWNLTEYTPKSQLLDREARRAEFAKLQSWGIRGVKIDFFPGDGQSVMQYYNDLAEDAARYDLVVNYHGSSLPRGLHRTLPNMMTMESIKGFEFITFTQENADKAAEHVSILPFTRNVYDPMDFTPTTFGEIPNIQRRTTNGFQVALPVLLLSGIQHIADTPDNMYQQPQWLQDYMKDIPVLWDETRFISGYPGKHVVLARRSGEKWYVVGINGEEKEKDLSLDLDFLAGKEGKLFQDRSARELVLETIEASNETDVSLLKNGGFVMIFEG